MSTILFASVVLPLPVPGTFTYRITDDQAALIKPGVRVSVPFGKKKTYVGLVVEIHDQPPQIDEIREIISVLDSTPVVLPVQLNLWNWICAYYLCPFGEVMKAALPRKLKIHSKPRQRKSDPRSDLTQLNDHQTQALREIRKVFMSLDVVLLHGVTSSGKTEIYMHLIQETLQKGRQVLYLLPEIALTTQIISRLSSVFGSRIAVYHSRSTDAERSQVWFKLLLHSGSDDSLQIVLGVRSSVFLPFSNLGLIIIDEEHENTYKQFDPAPRYHARDTAIMLARDHGAKVLLGTATPSIETYFNCMNGKYGLVPLNERYLNLQLPNIVVVNTRDLRRRKQMQLHFSPMLVQSMEDALQKKEQVILFQNRRGFSFYVECESCGHIARCKHCDVSLTYHKKSLRLVCHYCGYGVSITTKCDACHADILKFHGFGTEKIEEEIAEIFPSARVERLDLDATRRRKSYEEIISRFSSGESDILVGTQMISKGLDFENVKLVGIMNADTMLNYPDFRAHERSFQLMAQVSGRSGRRNSRGQVIIQASDDNHPVIRQVIENDYKAMFTEQLEERKRFHYPPYCRLVEITLKHRDKERLDQAADALANHVRQRIGDRVMGPEYPLVNRVQKLYLKTMLIKLSPNKSLAATKLEIQSGINGLLSLSQFRSVQVRLDVDPF